RSAQALAHLNNLVYSIGNVLSFLLAFPVLNDFGLFHSWWNASCLSLPSSSPLDSLFRFYYFSKIWEMLDTFLVLLQGAPVNAHFRVHHTTTLSLAWVFLEVKSGYAALFII